MQLMTQRFFQRFLLLALLLLAIMGCSAPQKAASLPSATATSVVEATAEPTETSSPTATLPPPPTFAPQTTNTPRPTKTVKPTSNPTKKATARPTKTPKATATVSATNTTTDADLPKSKVTTGEPKPYLTDHFLVTFYGSPWGPGLGILGDQSRESTDFKLRQHGDMFRPFETRRIMPAYHMITTVANPTPPLYRHQVDLPTIDDWLAAAAANNFAVIMDLQPSHADLMEEFERIRYALFSPDVHLAIDPEFTMDEGQIPNKHVGNLKAAQINLVQAELEKIALEIGVNKVLMLHQFKDTMLPDKEAIKDYPHVELIIDSDGTFNTEIKVYNYELYATEPAWEFGAIKVFYNYDDIVLSAEELMDIKPKPAIVIYQ